MCYNECMSNTEKKAIKTLIRKQIRITEEVVRSTSNIIQIVFDHDDEQNTPLHRKPKDKDQ